MIPKSLLLFSLLVTMTAQAKTTLTQHPVPLLRQATLQGVEAGPTLKLTASRSGTLESQPIEVPEFDTLILSWNGRAPQGSWLTLQVRVFTSNRWSRYYTLGQWSEDATLRKSVNGQKDADGKVSTDTLQLTHKATRYQYRVLFERSNLQSVPELGLITVMTSQKPALQAYTPNKQAWGKVLNVPVRSQMVFKDGGENWCSPTSTSMVMQYHGINVTVPEAVKHTFDPAYNGTGNWVFNTAFAGSKGLQAYVTRLNNFAEVEGWILKGVPVIISAGWKKGELPGAAIASTNGHLMVVVGFDGQGNVVMNDPAGKDDSQVRRTYNRQILEKLWIGHSGGTAYIIQKPGL